MGHPRPCPNCRKGTVAGAALPATVHHDEAALISDVVDLGFQPGDAAAIAMESQERFSLTMYFVVEAHGVREKEIPAALSTPSEVLSAGGDLARAAASDAANTPIGSSTTAGSRRTLEIPYDRSRPGYEWPESFPVRVQGCQGLGAWCRSRGNTLLRGLHLSKSKTVSRS